MGSLAPSQDTGWAMNGSHCFHRTQSRTKPGHCMAGAGNKRPTAEGMDNEDTLPCFPPSLPLSSEETPGSPGNFFKVGPWQSCGALWSTEPPLNPRPACELHLCPRQMTSHLTHMICLHLGHQLPLPPSTHPPCSHSGMGSLCHVLPMGPPVHPQLPTESPLWTQRGPR